MGFWVGYIVILKYILGFGLVAAVWDWIGNKLFDKWGF